MILRVFLQNLPREWVINENNYNLAVRLYSLRTIYIEFLKNFKVQIFYIRQNLYVISAMMKD